MRRTRKHIAECHEVLGVTPETPREEVKRAFKRIIMKHHPDLKIDDEKVVAEEVSKLYIEAYKVITDDEFLAKVAAFESGATGKNQPCYCESDKKYKHCCGR